jgi:hypothetical protein
MRRFCDNGASKGLACRGFCGACYTRSGETRCPRLGRQYTSRRLAQLFRRAARGRRAGRHPPRPRCGRCRPTRETICASAALARRRCGASARRSTPARKCGSQRSPPPRLARHICNDGPDGHWLPWSSSGVRHRRSSLAAAAARRRQTRPSGRARQPSRSAVRTVLLSSTWRAPASSSSKIYCSIIRCCCRRTERTARTGKPS